MEEEKKYLSLKEHRESIKNNPHSYDFDIKRCYKSVRPHLRKCGVFLPFKKKPYLEQYINEYVDMIFSAQNCKPFFYFESDLPFCWNVPQKGGWDLNYIKYEWGHLKSIHQNSNESYNLENLCLQSARCNQHLQSSLNVEELLEYGGKISIVIEQNMERRQKLFKTDKWKKNINYLLE